jgi:hypothetical protein
VFYSHDGGQHWQQQVMPGLVRTASGDPSVVFDPVRQVFVYSFIEFDRDANGNEINGRIETESSPDGVVWGNHVVLATDRGDITVDKPMSTVDSTPASLSLLTPGLACCGSPWMTLEEHAPMRESQPVSVAQSTRDEPAAHACGRGAPLQVGTGGRSWPHSVAGGC